MYNCPALSAKQRRATMKNKCQRGFYSVTQQKHVQSVALLHFSLLSFILFCSVTEVFFTVCSHQTSGLCIRGFSAASQSLLSAKQQLINTSPIHPPTGPRHRLPAQFPPTTGFQEGFSLSSMQPKGFKTPEFCTEMMLHLITVPPSAETKTD